VKERSSEVVSVRGWEGIDVMDAGDWGWGHLDGRNGDREDSGRREQGETGPGLDADEAARGETKREQRD